MKHDKPASTHQSAHSLDTTSNSPLSSSQILPQTTIATIAPTQNVTQVQVQWSGGIATEARYLDSIDLTKIVGEHNVGREVLITFLNNDRQQPVIIGVMASLMNQLKSFPEVEEESATQAIQVDSDGEKTIISARNQIKLECGQSSLILRKDGKIITKGKHILSRASSTNKIKGSSVEVN